MKTLLAKTLAKRIKDGDIIGLGSGTTVELALEQIGQRVAREKIKVTCVPTSYRSAMIAAELGIQVIAPISVGELNWAFDGADEVDPGFNMIKGRGAAMLTEKIMAKRAKEFIILVSEEKLVDKLGTNFPVPVEIVPEAQWIVKKGLLALGAKTVELRKSSEKYGPLVTEQGNLVFDAKFENINPDLEGKIKSLTGVVESGLFIGYTKELLIARSTGIWSRKLVGKEFKEELVEKG